ncbi:MAG: DNA recombination protein RmuC [Glycocaulis sp.]
MDPINLLLVAGGGVLAGAVIMWLASRGHAGRLAELRTDLAGERAARSEAEREAASLKARLEADAAAFEREKESLTRLSNEVREKFQLLAGEVLDKSQKAFLERAAETFKSHQEKAEGSVKEIVTPIRERLEAFRAQVEQIEKERAAHRGELGEQINALRTGLQSQSSETAKLVNALQRSSATRGQWGERTVENVLELAGLTKDIDYESQYQARDSEGAALRPDFVVRLPGGGRFVIDSKVALTAYLDAVEAPDEPTRKQHLRRHALQVKTHIRQLASKEYAKSVEGAIDFVALFIPGESFYSAAMEEEPGLFDEAIASDVIIVTPSTLLALAKAVAYGWRQQALEDNARKIAALGAEIHDRLQVFTDHLGRVGSGLKTATGNYNKAVASLEGRVLVSARRMAELNAAAGTKALQAPDQVEETPRALAAPEDDESA